MRMTVSLAALALVSFASSAAWAQSPDALAELRQQVEALRAEQQQSSRRIAELEAALARAAAAGQAAAPLATTAAPPAPANSPAAVSGTAPTPVAVAAASSPTPSKLQLSGDVRLRYESNFGDNDARNRDRGVLRARLRAAYAVNKWLTIGGQLATGDPDDPNSTDITLSNFDDDLQVSLDQVYARATFGNLQLHGGKMPQPFVRTDLVWDSDVSPEGLSAAYKVPLGHGASLKATGLYFLVDESVAGPDSSMIGGQLGFETAAAAQWKFELAAAYYDYSLRSVAGGDAGDFRSNLFANGRYLSDFNMLDIIGAVTWQGMSENWPVRLVGDYVKNFGAVTSQDTGYGVDLLVGRASRKGDWRFGYGYAVAETDAVLAAFSHDNTNIATNYMQHSLSADYMLSPNVMLNAVFYHYKPKSPVNAGPNDPNDWIDRLRLNFLVNF